MENMERFEGLSSAEAATLMRKKRAILIVLVTAGVVTPVGFAFVAILSGLWLYMIFFFLVALALMFFALRSSIQKVSSFNKDIREGQKKIVVNRIESQRQDIRQSGDSDDPRMVYTYLIKVKAKELEVSEAQYYQCKAGQLVEIQIAPNSNYVFGISVMQDSPLRNDPERASL
jgi:uncharacterized membrane protein